MTIPRELPLTGLLILVLSTSSWGQDAKESAPKTHTVKSGPFKVEVTLDGVFEAEDAQEILLRPEVWSTLKVEEVAPEGSRVKAGEVILKLETDKLDQEIRDQEFALQLSELSLRQAKVDLDALERSVPLDLEDARREDRIAEEELDYYLKVTEDQRKESAKENLKSAEYALEYEQEELNQLEQMYKADDLTEETEEIILKRAQRSVERADFFLRLAKDRYERTMDMEMPREKQRVEETATRAKLALRKTEATLPRSLEKQKIELEKLEHAHQQLEEKVAHLQADRKLMLVEAPVAGVVYYGQADRGKWTTAAALRKQLRSGGTITANTVIFTIVPDGPVFVRVDVPEKEFRHFIEGTAAVVKPTAFPDLTLDAKCGALGTVAVSEGTFDGRVILDAPDNGPTPVAGMTCKMTITPYQQEDAITVPTSAIFGEREDRHVYLAGDGEPEKQPVKTGKTAADQTEVLEGLSEGDVILLEKPQ